MQDGCSTQTGNHRSPENLFQPSRNVSSVVFIFLIEFVEGFLRFYKSTLRKPKSVLGQAIQICVNKYKKSARECDVHVEHTEVLGKMERIQNQAHSKTIIHIDIDCFYAQVELLKRPHLQNEPVGVKQKNIVVTCNYVARRFGVRKCMLVSEALKNCPQLLLFNGEDLYKYRQASNQIHLFLLSFTNKVEKSGFDENYLDVTDLVKESEQSDKYSTTLAGNCVGDLMDSCVCGCHKRLCIGSQIAEEIRTRLKTNLGFTSCCGISYNKLLAKLSCSAHKPNQQTTLLPNGTLEFLLGLNEIEKIPGVGFKAKQLLESINVRTVKDLQEIDVKELKKVFKSDEHAVRLKNLSFGVGDTLVKQTGKPHSIGIEDGFQKISVESDVKEKFRVLLQRLMVLVEEDGRVPMTIKVTIRKYDKERKMSNKEIKQSPIPTCLFSRPVGKLSEESANKLLNIIMGLFCKLVDISKPFHITLLGLAFSKFHEKVKSCSIASFLLKKRDLSVQSLTSFVSDETTGEATTEVAPTCSKSESDSEVEPSPKKTKLDLIIKKSLSEEDVEMCSPSKLKVENLNLNGDLDFPSEYPAGVDPNVFKELSKDVQDELIKEWKMSYVKPRPKCSKQSLIHVFCRTKNKT